MRCTGRLHTNCRMGMVPSLSPVSKPSLGNIGASGQEHSGIVLSMSWSYQYYGHLGCRPSQHYLIYYCSYRLGNQCVIKLVMLSLLCVSLYCPHLAHPPVKAKKAVVSPKEGRNLLQRLKHCNLPACQIRESDFAGFRFQPYVLGGPGFPQKRCLWDRVVHVVGLCLCLSYNPAFTKDFRSCKATVATFNRVIAGKYDAYTCACTCMHKLTFVFFRFAFHEKTLFSGMSLHLKLSNSVWKLWCDKRKIFMTRD